MIASEYGLTFAEVATMTLHEATIAINAIVKRKRQDMIFHAKCLGAEIKDDGIQHEENEVSLEQEMVMMKAAEEMAQRKGLKKRG